MTGQSVQNTPSPSAPLVTPAEFHRYLHLALERASQVEVGHFEEPRADLEELFDTATILIRLGIECLSLVVDYYERLGISAEKSTRVDFGLGEFGAEVDRRMANLSEAKDIADLAFVARMRLHATNEELVTFRQKNDRWDKIEVAGGSLRDLLKSLGAVERAVSNHEGISSENSFFHTELSWALDTRRCYRSFRLDVVGDGEPTPETLIRRLRLAATSIAKVTGREIYPNLRIQDRRQLREIQTRILSWLRDDPTSGRAQREGLRLWQDTAGFADLLRAVSSRAELREHDARIMTTAIEGSQTSNPASDRIGEVCLESLLLLTGLDDELDGLLETARYDPLAAWLPTLERLSVSLGASVDSPPQATLPAADSADPDFF